MILASQSPRRRELLGLFCQEFEVMPAQGEESLPDGISPREAVMLLSKQKAEEISARKFPDGNITDTIVAADTIVATDGDVHIFVDSEYISAGYSVTITSDRRAKFVYNKNMKVHNIVNR